jgi:predicted NAD-dependent protein-ADP-ribosyltransferase YbiA (DUF1768 family)
LPTLRDIYNYRSIIMNIQEIKDRFERDEQIEYLFFWSHRPNPDGTISKTCFSQWFEASALRYANTPYF